MMTEPIVPECGPDGQGPVKAQCTSTRAARFKKEFIQLLGVSVLAVMSYLFFSHFILQTVEVVGPSMNPTLHDSDRYFLNRWSYYLHAPRRSDIVVIRDPTDGIFVVKRIVAIPGETVCFKEGRVYVNDRMLEEPYVLKNEPTLDPSERRDGTIVCGKNQYFVLGDNRENSYDSRYYGPVRRERILGVVMR